ncbi:MAG: methyltransferase domain-containing protein [Gammaproteobacteria bacterium]|nr:methyltransferase domain-containing protein [Gammaproteobacteria bacterium]NIR97389.1 methyltransferase domain-containing protein [Gammaproteobacteria bacterium]NIT63042.1 methyltransferase domain-containing protein [Gammaproteobacteria bacterium]NIV20004.1 methyltransferase domain-containing protein [Gammaproteobacteria bacterium]NIX10080.1 methyltransferase domain-containing protein [Gammaproteobacteria bacterium]
MDNNSILSTYKRYARHYDAVFGPIFDPGRKTVVEKMNVGPGERVLEVGVGTGISLPYYPVQASVVGIDLSPDMLARAEDRIASEGLDNVSVEIMDAEHMCFSDGYFDKVVAMYVATVVANPGKLIAEMERVCKPGGDLYILNHFSNSNRAINAVEKLLSPFAKVLGFRPSFPMGAFVRDCALDVVEIEPTNLFGYWTLIHAKAPGRQGGFSA